VPEVDEGRVTRLLRAINERIERLTVAAGVPEVERGPWWLDSVNTAWSIPTSPVGWGAPSASAWLLAKRD
jgi:hypothetical protein